MKIPRQTERRLRFLAVLNEMPRLETWATDRVIVIGVDENGEDITKPGLRHHVKLIPRRVRRDMARKRSSREYRRDHALPEPSEKVRRKGKR